MARGHDGQRSRCPGFEVASDLSGGDRIGQGSKWQQVDVPRGMTSQCRQNIKKSSSEVCLRLV